VNRGDVVVASLPGDYGKPRPAVVVQSDILNRQEPASSVVCPLTTALTGARDFRVQIIPDSGNGLAERSEAMVDKLSAAPARALRTVIGRLDAQTMREIDRALLVTLGIA
jgi:mRNA interferase MazF